MIADQLPIAFEVKSGQRIQIELTEQQRRDLEPLVRMMYANTDDSKMQVVLGQVWVLSPDDPLILTAAYVVHPYAFMIYALLRVISLMVRLSDRINLQ